jgi:hypothetical protein
MTEQELRALVRDAIARHGAGSSAGYAPAPAVLFREHASHGIFPLPSGSDADGPCLIEPAVMCNHCGYCKSFGH